MLEHILAFQFGGFFGGTFGNLLSTWEQQGIFSYVLPFLLIFAIVFGVLSKISIFGDNKGINAVISLVVGLLALQFQMVPMFFSEIFPRLGVALSIILVLIILAGLFFDTKTKTVQYLFLGVAIIAFLVVISKSAGYVGWYNSSWWTGDWGNIIIVAVILGLIAWVIFSGSGKKPNVPGVPMHWG
jgi:hypothetical protein